MRRVFKKQSLKQSIVFHNRLLQEIESKSNQRIEQAIENNKKQMHLSYSQDILQRIRAQQSLNSTMRNFMSPNNPEPYQSTLLRAKNNDKNSPPRMHQAALSPLLQKPIFYNECIHDDDSRLRGRYRVRNYRQSQLKAAESGTKGQGNRWVSTSYSGLKEMMKQQIDKSSLKKSYDNIIERGDNEVVEKLKSELLFLPSSVKVPHRNRYRPNKRHSCNPTNKIVINGNRLEEKTKYQSNKPKIETELQNYPDSSKRTAGYELKYRRNYLDRKTVHLERKQQPKPQEDEQIQQDPLTGWS